MFNALKGRTSDLRKLRRQSRCKKAHARATNKPVDEDRYGTWDGLLTAALRPGTEESSAASLSHLGAAGEDDTLTNWNLSESGDGAPASGPNLPTRTAAYCQEA